METNKNNIEINLLELIKIAESYGSIIKAVQAMHIGDTINITFNGYDKDEDKLLFVIKFIVDYENENINSIT